MADKTMPTPRPRIPPHGRARRTSAGVLTADAPVGCGARDGARASQMRADLTASRDTSRQTTKGGQMMLGKSKRDLAFDNERLRTENKQLLSVQDQLREENTRLHTRLLRVRNVAAECAEGLDDGEARSLNKALQDAVKRAGQMPPNTRFPWGDD